MKRRLAVLLTTVAMTLGVAGTGSAQAAPAAAGQWGLPTAQLFATNNTAIITDPDDPRLQDRLTRFAMQVRGIIHANGGHPGSSTLLNGVFWSSDLQQATYERSREFDVNCVSAAGLHHIADQVRKQFRQESVLTFEYLPKSSPRATAFEVEVPGIDMRRLRDGLVANPAARDRLVGGSVTVTAKRLILIADLADFALVRAFVTELGGTWSASMVRYGAREFVG